MCYVEFSTFGDMQFMSLVPNRVIIPFGQIERNKLRFKCVLKRVKKQSATERISRRGFWLITSNDRIHARKYWRRRRILKKQREHALRSLRRNRRNTFLLTLALMECIIFVPCSLQLRSNLKVKLFNRCRIFIYKWDQYGCIESYTFGDMLIHISITEWRLLPLG